MDTSNVVGRRRVNSRINAEDQALDQIAKEVEFNVTTFFFLDGHALVNYIFNN